LTDFKASVRAIWFSFESCDVRSATLSATLSLTCVGAMDGISSDDPLAVFHCSKVCPPALAASNSPGALMGLRGLGATMRGSFLYYPYRRVDQVVYLKAPS